MKQLTEKERLIRSDEQLRVLKAVIMVGNVTCVDLQKIIKAIEPVIVIGEPNEKIDINNIISEHNRYIFNAK